MEKGGLRKKWERREQGGRREAKGPGRIGRGKHCGGNRGRNSGSGGDGGNGRSGKSGESGRNGRSVGSGGKSGGGGGGSSVSGSGRGWIERKG